MTASRLPPPICLLRGIESARLDLSNQTIIYREEGHHHIVSCIEDLNKNAAGASAPELPVADLIVTRLGNLLQKAKLKEQTLEKDIKQGN